MFCRQALRRKFWSTDHRHSVSAHRYSNDGVAGQEYIQQRFVHVFFLLSVFLRKRYAACGARDFDAAFGRQRRLADVIKTAAFVKGAILSRRLL